MRYVYLPSCALSRLDETILGAFSWVTLHSDDATLSELLND